MSETASVSIDVPAGHKPHSQQVNRACETCRALKVRCLPSTNSSSAICQRCKKLGKQCHYAPPQKRRQRKRTDTRVAELEKEVRLMRNLMTKESVRKDDEQDGEQFKDSDSDDFDYRSSEEESEQIQFEGVAHKSRASESGCNVPQKSSKAKLDVIDKGFLSLEAALKFFDIYANELTRHCPLVTFQHGQDPLEIRAKQPTLFLVVIAAAVGKSNVNLYYRLHKEVLKVFAKQLIMQGQRSFELVQAMLITALWLHPPGMDKDSLKFYQFIHMAATMALDIGLGGRGRGVFQVPSNSDSAGAEEATPFEHTNSSEISEDDAELNERRRTYLACYLLCSSAALALRRPNMLRFTSWASECLDSLEKGPNTTLLDKQLIAWVRLQHISEECGTSFAFDDPSANTNLSDSRMQLTLKTVESRLDEWRKSVDASTMNASLSINFHMNNIFLHEHAIHDNQPDDYRPPMLLKMSTPKTKPLGPATINAIMSCIDSSHALIDAFLGMSIADIQNGPIINFVRMAYSLVMLIKMSVSAAAPSSPLGKILDVENLRVDFYLKAAHTRMKQAGEPEGCQIPAKFGEIVVQLGCWYQSRHMQTAKYSGTGPQDLVRPLSDMAVTPSDMKPGKPSQWSLSMESSTNRTKEQSQAFESNQLWGNSSYQFDINHSTIQQLQDPETSQTRRSGQYNEGLRVPPMAYLDNGTPILQSPRTTSSISSAETNQFQTGDTEPQGASLLSNQNMPTIDFPVDMDVDFFSLFTNDATSGGSVSWLNDGGMNYGNMGQDWSFAWDQV